MAHATMLEVIFGVEDVDAHRKNDGAGAKSANRFLKRVREQVRGRYHAAKNLYLTEAHIDITNLAKAEFDWRAWLASRTHMIESIIGPGIVRISVASFLDCAIQLRMARMDFLLERSDGCAVRLHPEKDGKEANPLAWTSLDPQWLMLEVDAQGATRVRGHGRKTLGQVAARAMRIPYTGLEPPTREYNMLDFPMWQPCLVRMQEEGPPRHPASSPSPYCLHAGGGGAPGPAAGGGGAPAAGGGDAPGPAPGLEALPGLAAPTYTGPPAAGAAQTPMPATPPAPPPAGPAPDEQWTGHGGERWEWWPYGSRWPDGRWYLWVEGVGWQAR